MTTKPLLVFLDGLTDAVLAKINKEVCSGPNPRRRKRSTALMACVRAVMPAVHTPSDIVAFYSLLRTRLDDLDFSTDGVWAPAQHDLLLKRLDVVRRLCLAAHPTTTDGIKNTTNAVRKIAADHYYTKYHDNPSTAKTLIGVWSKGVYLSTQEYAHTKARYQDSQQSRLGDRYEVNIGTIRRNMAKYKALLTSDPSTLTGMDRVREVAFVQMGCGPRKVEVVDSTIGFSADEKEEANIVQHGAAKLSPHDRTSTDAFSKPVMESTVDDVLAMIKRIRANVSAKDKKDNRVDLGNYLHTSDVKAVIEADWPSIATHAKKTGRRVGTHIFRKIYAQLVVSPAAMEQVYEKTGKRADPLAIQSHCLHHSRRGLETTNLYNTVFVNYSEKLPADVPVPVPPPPPPPGPKEEPDEERLAKERGLVDKIKGARCLYKGDNHGYMTWAASVMGEAGIKVTKRSFGHYAGIGSDLYGEWYRLTKGSDGTNKKQKCSAE